MRRVDLDERGQDTGHQIIEMLNADRTLRIEMVTWSEQPWQRPKVETHHMRNQHRMNS